MWKEVRQRWTATLFIARTQIALNPSGWNGLVSFLLLWQRSWDRTIYKGFYLARGSGGRRPRTCYQCLLVSRQVEVARADGYKEEPMLRGQSTLRVTNSVLWKQELSKGRHWSFWMAKWCLQSLQNLPTPLQKNPIWFLLELKRTDPSYSIMCLWDTMQQY